MVKHSQYIIINANIEKSWAFLIDLSRSLIFDKFYLRIELPGKYSINKNYAFNVNAKYFFNNYKLKAEVKENPMSQAEEQILPLVQQAHTV